GLSSTNGAAKGVRTDKQIVPAPNPGRRPVAHLPLVAGAAAQFSPDGSYLLTHTGFSGPSLGGPPPTGRRAGSRSVRPDPSARRRVSIHALTLGTGPDGRRRGPRPGHRAESCQAGRGLPARPPPRPQPVSD